MATTINSTLKKDHQPIVIIHLLNFEQVTAVVKNLEIKSLVYTDVFLFKRIKQMFFLKSFIGDVYVLCSGKSVVF